MAFGQRSTQSGTQFGPNTKVFFVTIAEKNLDQPYFVIKTKQEGQKELVTVAGTDKRIKFLNGDLVDMRGKKGKTAEGKEIESTTAVFLDRAKDEAYLLTIGQTYLGRNILNSLIALKTFNGVEIGLYTSKPKPGQEKGFKSAAVRQSQNLIYGKFKNEEQPKIVKVQVGKEVHADSLAINAFFTAQVEEFAKVLRAANPAGVSTASNTVGGAAHEDVPTADDHGLEAQAETFLAEDEPVLPEGKKLLF